RRGGPLWWLVRVCHGGGGRVSGEHRPSQQRTAWRPADIRGGPLQAHLVVSGLPPSDSRPPALTPERGSSTPFRIFSPAKIRNYAACSVSTTLSPGHRM